MPDPHDAPTLPPDAPADPPTVGLPPGSDTATLPPAPGGAVPPPLTVPGYEILGELGRGGMGVVYQARHVRLNRVVALKMILAGGHADPRELIRFLAEAEAVAAIAHPHVVQVYEYGEHDGRPYMALEYLDGGSLAGMIRDRGRLPPTEAVGLVERIARGVQAAHDLGIVHRDLKPANVLLASGGRKPPVGSTSPRPAEPTGGLRPPLAFDPKVTDFGLAKRRSGADLTNTNAIMGTPAYMAPEQARGQTKFVGPAADVYALGAILYECLAGRPPFAADDTVALIMKVANDDPPALRSVAPDVPRDLDLICRKCLAKEPPARYPTAAALADDLARFRRGEPTHARPAGPAERAIKWVRRNKAAAAAGALVLTALVVGSVVSTYFGLQATAAADLAREEAVRAKQQEERADALRRAAEAAEAEQKRTTARVLVANARAELRAGNPVAALPWLARAEATEPSAHAEVQFNAVLAGLPRLALFGKHDQVVNHLAPAPDGNRFATGATDGTVQVWDAAAGTPVGPRLAFPGPVHAVAFSPDGTEVAAAGGTFLLPGKVIRYDAATGRDLGKAVDLDGTPIWVGYTADGRLLTAEYFISGGILALVRQADSRQDFTFHVHDGRPRKVYEAPAWGPPVVESVARVASAARGRVVVPGPTPRVIDLTTGAPIGRFAHDGPPAHLTRLTPDGRYAILIGNDMTARVQDLDAGADYQVPLGHFWTAVAATVDERGQLAVAFYDGFVQRYTLADGKPVPRSSGTIGEQNWHPEFSPDGMFLAAAAQGGVGRVWRTDDREPVCPPLRHGGAVTTHAFLADGRRMAVGAGDGTVRVWDFTPIERASFRADLSFAPADVRFLSDDRFAASGGGNQWREHPDKITGVGHSITFKNNPDVVDTAVAAGGERVFSGTDGGAAGGEVRVIDARPGIPPAGPLKHAKRFVIELDPTPDGRLLATLDVDGLLPQARFLGNAQVWDVAAGKRVFGPVRSVPELTGITDLITALSKTVGITTLAVHPAGGRVALAHSRLEPAKGFESYIELYDLATGKPVGRRLPVGPQMFVEKLKFSPDGRYLAAGAAVFAETRGEVAVWDAATGAAVVAPVAATEKPRSLTFSPDGRLLAVAVGNRVLLFDTTAGRPPDELLHAKPVRSARFDRGGAVLVTTAESDVYLWDPATRELVRPPLIHNYRVTTAAVSADGGFVVAAGHTAVMGWRLAGGRRDADTVARLTRLLSCTVATADAAVPAAPDRLAADWNALRAEAPDELRVRPADAADWHNRQGSAAIAADRWAAAGRHLEARNRADTATAWYWFETGTCYLRAGDRAGVRRAFAELARLAPTDPAGRHWPIEIGLTDPDVLPPADRDRAVRLAEQIAAAEKTTEWEALACGLAFLRAGRPGDAERWVLRARGLSKDEMLHARADAQLALVRRAQGRSAEAADLTAAADQVLAKYAGRGAFDEWLARVFLRSLLAEARRPPREAAPPPRPVS